jgi:hypothetical protein
MELTVTPFGDAQFRQPVPNDNATDGVTSFWLMRAC